MDIRLDRRLPVPIAVQLQGQIEFGMVNGDFPPGSRLQSVRDLAAELGVSPVTVGEAYRTLAERGLIETVQGRGTFVRSTAREARENLPLLAFEAQAAQLVRHAERTGIGSARLLEAVGRQLAVADDGRALRLLLVGVYDEATRGYASSLRRWLRRDDRIATTTFARLERDGRAELQEADVLLTFAHRERELQGLGADRRIVTLELMPSRRTRTALAALEPRSRVGVVAVAAFLPTLKRSVERFASHVAAATPVVVDETDPSALADVETVVYGTGCEAILDDLPGGVHAFEYRHEPDPAHVEGTLLPLLGKLRREAVAA